MLSKGVVSKDHLAILRAIRPGRDALGTGSTEDELASQFPDRMHRLRELDAEGYVDRYVVAIRETGNPSPDIRVYHRTEKGEAALRATNG